MRATTGKRGWHMLGKRLVGLLGEPSTRRDLPGRVCRGGRGCGPNAGVAVGRFRASEHALDGHAVRPGPCHCGAPAGPDPQFTQDLLLIDL